jgi:hypothetical protein
MTNFNAVERQLIILLRFRQGPIRKSKIVIIRSAEEYKKLTVEQREELRQKRSKRGHKPGSKSSKVPPNKKSKFDRQVAQLTKQVSALTEKLEAQSKVPNVVSTDMLTSTTELTEQTNRSNPALSRQKTQGK